MDHHEKTLVDVTGLGSVEYWSPAASDGMIAARPGKNVGKQLSDWPPSLLDLSRSISRGETRSRPRRSDGESQGSVTPLTRYAEPCLELIGSLAVSEQTGRSAGTQGPQRQAACRSFRQ